jgi:hypothetical protein
VSLKCCHQSAGGRAFEFLWSEMLLSQAENGKGPRFGAFSTASVNRLADLPFKSAGAKRLSRPHNVIRDGSA